MEKRHRFVLLFILGAVMVIALGIIVGWVFDLTFINTIFPEQITVRVSAVLLFFFAGVVFLTVIEALELSKVRTEAMMDNMGEGLIIFNTKSKITTVNRYAEKLLGKSKEMMVKKYIADAIILSGEDKKKLSYEKTPLALALARIETIYSEDLYVHKKNRRIPIAITVSPVFLNRKLIGGIAIFRDIETEKEINRAKTEFVSLASHQLRTPLSSVNWYTEMILDGDVGAITDGQREYLNRIHESNQRMTTLVTALLDASKIELGTFILEPVATDLVEMSENVFHELEQQIIERKLVIEKKYIGDLKNVLVDQKYTRIIFQNLLSNAVKYTPVSGRVTLEIGYEKNKLHIAVTDTGYGIPEEQENKVFTKLFRGRNILDKDTDGAGLGMYIVKSIVDHSGGKVWFESEENKGTTFFVDLPVKANS